MLSGRFLEQPKTASGRTGRAVRQAKTGMTGRPLLRFIDEPETVIVPLR
jgi:hypothetical protein